MESVHVHIIDYVFYVSLFLLATSLLYILAKKISFPYTVALLIVGFLGQFSIAFFNLNVSLQLSPDFTYYILLPILLFEAALHINIHQFKMQFKTITFLATFGLMTSVFGVAFGLTYLLGLPFEVALLFGAIISATDPIAVLSLFKTLGAPKRLALLADGESMFNDATAVIAFRIISGFVVAEEAFQSQTLINSVESFLYVFIGSLVLGTILGYITTIITRRIQRERIINIAIVTSLAIGSFSIAEHVFEVSGVITTVIAGIAFGNLARGRMKQRITVFIEEYLGYLGFLALSIVFYFASFNLDLGLFTSELPTLLLVIAVVLVARAISVYGTLFISNRIKLFKDEPNVPMSWQHVLNWGGLRGVIPLVLVYSLPDTFIYKQMMLQFTFAALLFTLFINGLTIKTLLVKLKLHLPGNEETIIDKELKLFDVDHVRKRLKDLPVREFDASIIKSMDANLAKLEKQYKTDIIKMADTEAFIKSLKLEAIAIERETVRKLFEQGRFTEQVLYEFESELDLQQDALEFPNLYKVPSINGKGEINARKAFRKRLIALRQFIAKYTMLSKILRITEQDVILERFALLRVRLFTSFEVLDYLKRLELKFAENKSIVKGIKEVRDIQMGYVKKNQAEVSEISKEYPEYVKRYQKKVISKIIYS